MNLIQISLIPKWDLWYRGNDGNFHFQTKTVKYCRLNFLCLVVYPRLPPHATTWAKWAIILQNSLTDEQLCSQIHSLISACLNMFKNSKSFIASKITINWAKWANWAKMLENTLTDEQLCSKTSFLVYACSNKYGYTPSMILLKS